MWDATGARFYLALSVVVWIVDVYILGGALQLQPYSFIAARMISSYAADF